MGALRNPCLANVSEQAMNHWTYTMIFGKDVEGKRTRKCANCCIKINNYKDSNIKFYLTEITYDRKIWTEFICLRIGTSGGLF
jgi:hypothetical protein